MESADFVEVDEKALAKLQASNGAAIQKLTERSGAQLSIEPMPGGAIIGLAGDDGAITKARAMLKAMVGFQKAAPVGICKWYAAGFCRFGQDGKDACQNGSHAVELATKAEQEWVKASEKGGDGIRPGRPLLLVLSVEDREPPTQQGWEGANEIIEMAVSALCPRSGKELGRFHRFIRPLSWDQRRDEMQRSNVPACFNQRSNATAFTDIVADLLDWLPALLSVSLDDLSPEDFLIVTFGDFGVETALPRQCDLPTPGTVDSQLQDFLFCRWANIGDLFKKHFQVPDNDLTPLDLTRMLRHCGLQFTGQQHLGMDDTSNVVKVVQELIRQGASMMPTAERESVSQPTIFALGARRCSRMGLVQGPPMMMSGPGEPPMKMPRLGPPGDFGAPSTQFMPPPGMPPMNGGSMPMPSGMMMPLPGTGFTQASQPSNGSGFGGHLLPPPRPGFMGPPGNFHGAGPPPGLAPPEVDLIQARSKGGQPRPPPPPSSSGRKGGPGGHGGHGGPPQGTKPKLGGGGLAMYD